MYLILDISFQEPNLTLIKSYCRVQAWRGYSRLTKFAEYGIEAVKTLQ